MTSTFQGIENIIFKNNNIKVWGEGERDLEVYICKKKEEEKKSIYIHIYVYIYISMFHILQDVSKL